MYEAFPITATQSPSKILEADQNIVEGQTNISIAIPHQSNQFDCLAFLSQTCDDNKNKAHFMKSNGRAPVCPEKPWCLGSWAGPEGRPVMVSAVVAPAKTVRVAVAVAAAAAAEAVAAADAEWQS